jgi:hypothetical protein
MRFWLSVVKRDFQTTLTYSEPWSGRIWGRIDCYSVDECGAAGPIPASLSEITVGDGNAFYDLSLVDGFNIDLSVSRVLFCLVQI